MPSGFRFVGSRPEFVIAKSSNHRKRGFQYRFCLRLWVLPQLVCDRYPTPPPPHVVVILINGPRDSQVFGVFVSKNRPSSGVEDRLAAAAQQI